MVMLSQMHCYMGKGTKVLSRGQITNIHTSYTLIPRLRQGYCNPCPYVDIPHRRTVGSEPRLFWLFVWASVSVRQSNRQSDWQCEKQISMMKTFEMCGLGESVRAAARYKRLRCHVHLRAALHTLVAVLSVFALDEVQSSEMVTEMCPRKTKKWRLGTVFWFL